MWKAVFLSGGLACAGGHAFADDASAFRCGVVTMGELDNTALHRAAHTEFLIACLKAYPDLVQEAIDAYNKGMLAAEKPPAKETR